MSRVNKRRILVEPIDDDDIVPIETNIEQAQEEAQQEEIQQDDEINEPCSLDYDLEANRRRIKEIFYKNPHLNLEKPDEKLKIIDTMTEDQLKTVEMSVKAQLSKRLDGKFSGNVIRGINNMMPCVDNESLQMDVERDQLFQEAWNQMVSVKLSDLPELVKIGVLYSSHLFNNFRGLGFKKRRVIGFLQNETTGASVPNVNMREVELGENDPAYEPPNE